MSAVLLRIADSDTAMQRIGAELAKALIKNPTIKAPLIYLYGELGAGKTTLVRGFLRVFSDQDRVKSPSYSLIESYSFPAAEIHHFDLYRLSGPAELEDLGYRDYFDSKAVCLIEWAERGEGWLPAADIAVRIAIDGESRRVNISAATDNGDRLLAAMDKKKKN